MNNTLPTLYSRNLAGHIMQWDIDVVNFDIIINTGRYKGNLREIRKIPVLKKTDTSIEARAWADAQRSYLDKINIGGYKEYMPNSGTFDEFLVSLSSNKVDANLRRKPQKAFKGFPKKFPYNDCTAQPKVNGLRTTLSWEVTIKNPGMFQEIIERAVFRSMNGLEYYMPHITNDIPKSFFEDDTNMVYDGELYGVDMTVNQIKSCVPMVDANGTLSKPSSNPLLIGFVMFDLSIPDIIQVERLDQLREIGIQNKIAVYLDAKQHLDPLNILMSDAVTSKEQAEQFMYTYINRGFEGAILRVKEAEYGFGSRSSKIMAKLKLFEDTECVIIDIIFKREDSIRTYISFVLKNDINDSTFEATPKGDEAQRVEYLNNKEYYIGRKATIQFYERSGVKKVPWHSNVIAIRDNADLGL